MSDYSKLGTEARNPRTAHIDKASSAEIVRLMNAENLRAVQAVGEAEEKIAAAIDGIAERIGRGGRLIYVGAGTSGRLGALDAAECPPTFGVGYDDVVAVMAGGKNAFFRAASDSFSSGVYARPARSRMISRLSMRLSPRKRLLISRSKGVFSLSARAFHAR